MIGYILMGSPGAGKGTIGQILSDDYGISHFSSGDLLRAEVEQQTDIGERIQTRIANGEQVDDDLITSLVLTRIRHLVEVENQNSFVLDGFPQTHVQRSKLQVYLEQFPSVKLVYLHVEVEPEQALDRMVKRVSCAACRAIFSRDELPDEEAGDCPRCTGDLVTRRSDKVELAVKRLETFAATTEPLMKSNLQDRLFPVVEIDGNASKAAVIAQLAEQLTF
jgi:adenylate kinase